MTERNQGKLIRRKIETTSVVGIPLVSTVTEEFDFRSYPKNIRRGLQKSAVPKELYPDALAVIGRAYGRAASNWTSEKMGETSDLVWKVPAAPDFQACVDNLRNNVGADALVDLSDRLFGSTETTEELLMSMRNEIDLIFNPPEEKK